MRAVLRLNPYLLQNVCVTLRLCTDFLVWLRNRLISAGLESVLSHIEKLCIASFYRQFSSNIKIRIIKLKLVLLGPSI